MIKTNPFAVLWNQYDTRLERDVSQNKDNIYYKSTYAPMFKIQGVFSNGRLNINLSDMYTYLIQQVGRFCERYASDFLITYESMEKAIRNTNPDMQDEFRFVGIRESGVDDVAYVISRMTHDEPSKLQSYYRKLYGIRIRHEGLRHAPSDASYVFVELRDFTNEIYSMAKSIQEQKFTVDDYYRMTKFDKRISCLDHIYHVKNVLNELKVAQETAREEIAKLERQPEKNYVYALTQHIWDMESHIRALMQDISCTTFHDAQNDDHKEDKP